MKLIKEIDRMHMKMYPVYFFLLISKNLKAYCCSYLYALGWSKLTVVK